VADAVYPAIQRRRSGAGFSVSVDRRPNAVLIDVAWPDGRELFFVVNGDRSVGIMAFDGSDESHREPRVYVVPRPYGWTLDVADDELLLLVWQMLGEQR
jgi:hypothetical protein